MRIYKILIAGAGGRIFKVKNLIKSIVPYF